MTWNLHIERLVVDAGGEPLDRAALEQSIREQLSATLLSADAFAQPVPPSSARDNVRADAGSGGLGEAIYGSVWP